MFVCAQEKELLVAHSVVIIWRMYTTWNGTATRNFKIDWRERLDRKRLEIYNWHIGVFSDLKMNIITTTAYFNHFSKTCNLLVFFNFWISRMISCELKIKILNSHLRDFLWIPHSRFEEFGTAIAAFLPKEFEENHARTRRVVKAIPKHHSAPHWRPRFETFLQ